MSSHSCPGCGNDAPISQECSRCEKEASEITAPPILGWPGSLIRALLARLRATRVALHEALSLGSDSLAQLLAVLEKLTAAQRAESALRDQEHELRAQLDALRCQNRAETERQRRERLELRQLRERLSVYEARVDDAELAERIHAVEAEHAAFAAAERGEGLDGFASWCGNCEAFIVAIRQLQAQLRYWRESAS